MAETLIPNCIHGIPCRFSLPLHFPQQIRHFHFPIPPLPLKNPRFRPLASPSPPPPPSSSSFPIADQEQNYEAMGVESLEQFIHLNLGKWNGSFYQFDAHGNLLQNVTTKLSVGSYGEDELISLIQTLYIKQPLSGTFKEEHESEPEWAEYRIKETNLFTVDKYQQIGFFPREKAFSLRYQTAGMLETVLRAGVLGEDDTGEESPKNLEVPSRRPSVVCENCLYSLHKDMRARAFHIMDPHGILQMLLVFLEERGDKVPDLSSSCSIEDIPTRITPLLGRWQGHSLTKRSGVYGATIAEADTIALLELNDRGQLIQVNKRRKDY